MIGLYGIFKSGQGRLFEEIADKFMLTEVILFKWLALISLIVISNVSLGSNFDTSVQLFVLSI